MVESITVALEELTEKLNSELNQRSLHDRNARLLKKAITKAQNDLIEALTASAEAREHAEFQTAANTTKPKPRAGK